LLGEIYKITQDDLYELLKRLARNYKIIGPVKKGSRVIFDYADKVSEVLVDYDKRILLPPKKFFLPPREVLFEYEILENDVIIRDRLGEISREKRVLIGVKSCDITSIEILKKTFDRHFKDPYVLTRIKNTVIIGVMCRDVSPTCFCYQAGSGPLPRTGCDLFLTRLSDDYLIEVKSEQGQRILNNNKDLLKTASSEDIQIRNRIIDELIERMKRNNLPELAEAYDSLVSSYESELWNMYAEKCLACGKCNFVCPTCHCFDVHDEVSLDFRYGARIREWDSCHFLSFTRVASGEIFRKDRSSRIKQRIYHKLVYSVNDIGVISCVGCGRCVEVCPASIDIREVIRKFVRR